MKKLALIVAALVTWNTAVASDEQEGSATVRDGRTVYEILSQTPNIQALIVRKGLAFQLQPVVAELQSFMEATPVRS